MEGLAQDLGRAARRLARRAGLTSVAVIILGLGLGGATALFSVADAVILRPLPFADEGRLVLFWQTDLRRSQPFVEMSYPTFRDYRERNDVFDELAGMPSTNQGLLLTGSGEPTPLEGRWVTGNFFSVMGVAPLRGRMLEPEDDRPGAPRVIVLSHALWRGRFSADAEIVGKSLTLDDQPYTVIGVAPPRFEYPTGAHFWTPLVPAAGKIAEDPEVWWMSGLGRLKRGITVEQARGDLSALTHQYNRDQYSLEGFAAVLTPVANAVFGSTRPALLALLGAVGLVLLIACANVAALLLVDLNERRGELAVRQALGASAATLVRGLLAETVLLGLMAGALGLLLAHVVTPLLVGLSPSDVPRLGDVEVNSRALLFSAVVTALTTCLCGLAPLLLARSAALEPGLRAGSRGIVSARSPLRSTLVVAEVALALVLLVGAGLLLRSFSGLRRAPLGFEPAGVLSVGVGLPQHRYPDPPRWRAFHQQLLERVAALPGVTSAATVTLRPLWGTVGMDWPFTLEGQSPKEAERNPLLNFETVSPDYFRTMGLPLIRGRAFTSADSEGQPGVVVVSESLARRAWPGQQPIGKRLKTPLPGTPYHNAWLTVVGVAAEARYREIQASRFDLYMCFLQSNHAPQHLMVRSSGEPTALVPAIRDVVRGLDADQPVTETASMTEIVLAALGGPRFAARLFGGFAVVALLLAVLGLYGLLAYAVSRRTREIGVRVAVGARPGDVRRLVMREGLGLTVAGIFLGLLAAAASVRLLGALLYEVRPTDPLTFAVAPLLLLAIAAAACLVPARRAIRVDAVVALRTE